MMIVKRIVMWISGWIGEWIVLWMRELLVCRQILFINIIDVLLRMLLVPGENS